MTIKEIINRLLTIQQRLYPDLAPDERTAIHNAVTLLLPIAEALEALQK